MRTSMCGILLVLGLPLLTESSQAQAEGIQPQGFVRIPEKLTLESALGLLRFHPSLRAKQLEIDVEKGDVIDAEKYSNPSFSFTSDGIVFDADRGSLLNRIQPSVVFRQEILTAGKRQKRTRVELADTEIVSMEVHDLHRVLRFDVKQAYFQVVLAQEDLRLAREILDQFEGVVRLNRIRFEKGEISGGELRRTEAAQYRFLEDVIQAEVRLENAKDRLLATLGNNDFDQDYEAVDPFDSKFVPPPLAQLAEIALRERPDLAAQRARVNRSGYAVDLEKARAVPNISLFAGYQRELDSSGPVVGIDIPLFVFNRNQGRINRVEAERRQETERVRLREITVLAEVRIALEQLNGNRRRIEALEGEYLEKARQARDITEASYRLGEASLIEFLDAERTYSETRRLYNQALYDFEISRAALQLAVGEDL
ncbi:MAG: TolC family protein [Acidobacteriota bacterium]